jgi:hypothetical protein
VTDGFLNLDGIYIDDVRVYVYKDDLTAVHEPGMAGDLRVWPNPTSDGLWISVGKEATNGNNVRISVTNALGAEVERRMMTPGSEATRLETSAWSKGLYLVSLFDDGRITATRKVVVD